MSAPIAVLSAGMDLVSGYIFLLMAFLSRFPTGHFQLLPPPDSEILRSKKE